MRVTFQDQLWKRLGPPLHVPNTRPQCLELAASAKTETIDLPIAVQTAGQLWKSFNTIDLKTDACLRGKKGACLLVMDGTAYVVQTGDGTSVKLTEVESGTGVRSENPALWPTVKFHRWQILRRCEMIYRRYNHESYRRP
jgi:hypothetical protein